MKFKFLGVHEDYRTGEEAQKITVESNQECLTEVLADFRSFLLACGYYIPGELIEEEYESFDEED